MRLNSEQVDHILTALNEKAPNAACPLCGIRDWEIQAHGIVFLVLQELPLLTVQMAGTGVPAVAVTCRNCGNTHLLNVFNLGVADFLGIKPSGEEEADV